MNIVRCDRETVELNEKKFYKYQWKLTKNGQKFVDENKCLQEIWGDGKNIRVLEFYNEIMKLIGEEQKKGKS